MLQKLLNKIDDFDLLTKLNTADRFLEDNKLLIGGAAVVGAAGFLTHELLLGSKRSDYLSASALGKRGTGLEKILFDETEEFDSKTKATLASGELYHQAVESIFGASLGAESEVKVIDDALGVKGYVDIMLPGNIPVEVKTISSKGLQGLSEPLSPHKSQLNFYLHARKAKYGYLLYLDAQDASNTKVFKVGYEPGRLISDVEEARSKILLNPSRASRKSVGWLTDTFSANPSYFNGIRHSSGFASSWDSIKENDDFPGGRLNSIVQASQYRNLRSTVKEFTPTLGLTTRLHEVAIGHKARSKGPRIARKMHPNASRAYR